MTQSLTSDPAASARVGQAQEPPAGAPAEAGAILLVSDSREDVMAARRLLDGFVNSRVVVAGTAAEALRLLRSDGEDAALCPAMILLDLKTPRMNGFDFLIHVRADPTTRDLLIVVLANIGADTPAHELLSGQEHSEDNTFPKPHTTQELLATLQALGVSWLEPGQPLPRHWCVPAADGPGGR